MESSIAILLATYNGENYLEEQIDSILAQTNKEWTLFIRDDGSSDNTQTICLSYVKRYPNKIVLIEDELIGGSAGKNFFLILFYIKDNYKNQFKYFLFSDQDDYWHRNKIQLSKDKINEIEMEHPASPVLVHTDLKVVDSNRKIISNSFFKYSNINPKITTINRLLIQNNCTGCTMMFNHKLFKIVKNSSSALMHD